MSLGVAVEAAKNAFWVAAEFIGWKRESANRANTPEMQANARAAQDSQVVDDARKAVAEQDVDEIRRRLS